MSFQPDTSKSEFPQFDLKLSVASLERDGYGVNRLEVEGLPLLQSGEWNRYWTGTAVERRTGALRFVKIAADPKVAPFLHNQVVWHQLVHAQGGMLGNVTVPAVFAEGLTTQKYPYAIFEYVQGQVLTTREIDHRTLIPVIQSMGEIVTAAEHIMRLAPIKDGVVLPKDQGNPFATEEAASSNFMLLPMAWRYKITEALGEDREVETLWRYLELHQDAYMPATCHGDFTPWHMMWDVQKNCLVLIDAEDADQLHVWGFDFAYFFARTYEHHMLLAFSFWETLHKQHIFTQQEWICFKMALAMRIIGGIFDTTKYKGHAREKFHELFQFFVSLPEEP